MGSGANCLTLSHDFVLGYRYTTRELLKNNEGKGQGLEYIALCCAERPPHISYTSASFSQCDNKNVRQLDEYIHLYTVYAVHAYNVVYTVDTEINTQKYVKIYSRF